MTLNRSSLIAIAHRDRSPRSLIAIVHRDRRPILCFSIAALLALGCSDGEGPGANGDSTDSGPSAAGRGSGDDDLSDDAQPDGGALPSSTLPCSLPTECPAGRTCRNGQCELIAECGAAEFEVEAVPPNLMIVLDRSCSMPACAAYPGVAWVDDHPCAQAGAGASTMLDKWATAVSAIELMTTEFGSAARWGLQLFPDSSGDACALDAPSVQPSPGTAMQVQAVLRAALDPMDPNFPNGPCNTMTGGALAAMRSEASLQDPSRDSYLLLITDGAEYGCDKDEAVTEQTVADLFASGIPTFVVGFGGEVDPAALEALALAGGVPRSGSPSYYQADDAAGLEGVLSGVVTRVVRCDFALGEMPPNAEELYVFLDDEPIERETPDGWVYDPALNRVSFQGESCAALQAGSASDIDVVFGCPRPSVD
jgi:hypothetical protein